MVKKAPKPEPGEPEVLTVEGDGTAAPPFPDNATDNCPPGTPPDTATEGKSIGDLLAKGPDIADCQIGDRVTHPSHGDGTVTDRNDITLWVKHDKGSEPIMHSIQFAKGTLKVLVGDAGAGKPPVPQVAPSAIPEAAKPLTDAEIDALHTKAMFAHAAQGQMLAARARDLKTQQTTDQAALNEIHKALKEAQEAVVAHAEQVPKREQFEQKTIAFEQPAPLASSTAPTPSQDSLGYSVPGDSIMSLKESGVTLADLHNALFPEFKPGKKAKDVGKMALPIKDTGYLIREKSKDGTRWFAQLLVDEETWKTTFQEKFGLPVVSFDTSAEARQVRHAGGEDCGRIVKVGKRTCVLAPEDQGLVIVASKEEVEKYVSWQKASNGEQNVTA